MAPSAVEPPPPPRRRVADRAGTLQGQLRALSAKVLQTTTFSSSDAGAKGGFGVGLIGGRLGGHHLRERGGPEEDAAVSRMQRRALEVLLRVDRDTKKDDKSGGVGVGVAKVRKVKVLLNTNADAGEGRNESNSLKLGGILLAMRTRGDGAAADLMVGRCRLTPEFRS